jgi:hypothetical protein
VFLRDFAAFRDRGTVRDFAALRVRDLDVRDAFAMPPPKSTALNVGRLTLNFEL